jgi:hypothetical protein
MLRQKFCRLWPTSPGQARRRAGETASALVFLNGPEELSMRPFFGVLHHLLVTERVPLREILDLAAELTRQWLVIEFIAPEDEMFKMIARGRNALYSGLIKDKFEAAGKCPA